MIEAYPLCWPEGWPRAKRKQEAPFKTRFAAARDATFHEIRLMGGKNVVLSSNLELRLDGIPYANQRQPDDAGVAVYFQYKDKSMVFACDRWRKVEDNVQAIRKTIEAIRGIERWGASDMMERAFTGFVQLPSPDGESWWDVLQVGPRSPWGDIEAQYRVLAKEAHPDRPGGSHEAMQRLNVAREQARQELGVG